MSSFPASVHGTNPQAIVERPLPVPGRSLLTGRPFILREKGPQSGGQLTDQETSDLLRLLTGRDIAILTALAQYRYLDREQIDALFFPSIRSSQHRLKELKERGLLLRWRVLQPPGWRPRPSVFVLSTRGARLLAACRGDHARSLVRTSQHAQTHCFHLTHDVEANGFFVAVAAASRELAEEGLYHWVGEEACRRDSRAGHGALSPDGWGRYLTPTGEVIFLLEWDRGTESPSRVEAKAMGYLRYFLDRREAELNHVLVVTPGAAREEAMRSAINRVLRPTGRRPRCRFWTSNVELLHRAGPTGTIWTSVEGQAVARARLADLPSLPRSTRRAADGIGKPHWWERRPGGGEGA